MKTYSFLSDELAIIEIRKHKWIESEKKGDEIGFASAAIDWIKKYGRSWLQHRLNLKEKQNELTEKRHHRRFNRRLPVEIKIKDANISCHTDDFNLVGLSCTVPAYIANDLPTEITIRFLKDEKSFQASRRFQFTSRIARVSKKEQFYNIFVPFTEEVRDFLRSHTDILTNTN
jgi:hypothetical protein